VSAAAWYVIESPRWWARWFNVLHWPYTAWHLSYPALGAMMAESINWAVLGWTVLAFFLGMGVAGHCLDLIKGDPLRLGLNPRALGIVGGSALGLAASIGFWQWALGNIPTWLYQAIPIGLVLVVGYNLEVPGFHGDWRFAAWWAGFPLLVGYFAQEIALTPALGPVLTFVMASAYAQRVLSTRARYLRRRVAMARVYLLVEGTPIGAVQAGQVPEEGKDWLLAPLDRALMWLTLMMVSLAAGLVVFRLFGA
jgi:hypothetical protein